MPNVGIAVQATGWGSCSGSLSLTINLREVMMRTNHRVGQHRD